MRVLITFASSRGGTQGLAEMVAEDLREEGFDVDVLPPRRLKRLDGYDAVIVGGALYASRWHREARRFVKRHTAELRRRLVYFFSSGPLDDSATGGDIPPVKGVKALMERVGARGHVTFGGRLLPRRQGVPGQCHGEEAGRRLARSGASQGLDPDGRVTASRHGTSKRLSEVGRFGQHRGEVPGLLRASARSAGSGRRRAPRSRPWAASPARPGRPAGTARSARRGGPVRSGRPAGRSRPRSSRWRGRKRFRTGRRNDHDCTSAGSGR